MHTWRGATTGPRGTWKAPLFLVRMNSTSLPFDGDHLSSMPEYDFQLAVDASTVSRSGRGNEFNRCACRDSAKAFRQGWAAQSLEVSMRRRMVSSTVVNLTLVISRFHVTAPIVHAADRSCDF